MQFISDISNNKLDLNILDKVTIIITRHYENYYVLRLLKYYKSYNYPSNILILDSSTTPIIINEHKELFDDCKIAYIKFNNKINMFKKLLEGLKNVSTPYSVICSDDDFITPNGIAKSVDFLDRHRDYEVAHGQYISFWFDNKDGKTGLFLWKPNSLNKSISSSSPQNRLSAHLLDYFPTYSAVHRTELMRLILEETINYTDDYRLGELLPSLITLIFGKMKCLDILYCAREYNPSSSGQTISRICDFMNEDSYKRKYMRFRKCLAKHLSYRSRINLKESEKIINRSMAKYIDKKFRSSLTTLKLKAKIKQIIKRTGLFSSSIKKFARIYKKLFTYKRDKILEEKATKFTILFDDPKSEFYGDLIKIRDIVESNQ